MAERRRSAIGPSGHLIPEDGIGGELDLASLLRRERGQQLVQLLREESGRRCALGLFPKLQMQDWADGLRMLDHGHDCHRPRATRTSQGVDFVDLEQQPSPVLTTGSGKAIGIAHGLIRRRLGRHSQARQSSLPPRGIRIPTVIADHLLAGIRNVRDDPSDSIQGVQGSGHAFGCAVVDLSRAGFITRAAGSKAGSQEVGRARWRACWSSVPTALWAAGRAGDRRSADLTAQPVTFLGRG